MKKDTKGTVKSLQKSIAAKEACNEGPEDRDYF